MMKVGSRFGRLVYLRDAGMRGGGKKRHYGEFACDCGTKKMIRLDSVKSGETKSCGCLYHNACGLDSADYETLYNVWRNMVSRCHDSRSDRYYTYGARGIQVCTKWRTDFRGFAAWAVKNGWGPGLSIERRDVNASYTPENCCFIPMAEQARNRTSNIRIVIDGKDKCLSEWCDQFGVKVGTAWMRHKRGHRDPEVLFYIGDIRHLKAVSA